MRERAFSHFEATPMPTAKHENWKYTDIRPLYDTTYIALNKAPGSDPDDLHLSDLPLPSFTPHVAVFLDDEFCRRLSNVSALPEGVELTTIRSLLQRKSPTLALGPVRAGTSMARYRHYGRNQPSPSCGRLERIVLQEHR